MLLRVYRYTLQCYFKYALQFDTMYYRHIILYSSIFTFRITQTCMNEMVKDILNNYYIFKILIKWPKYCAWICQWLFEFSPVDFQWTHLRTRYSLNKKEWICSLFKEWILERVKLEWIWSEFGVNICVIFIHSFWSYLRDHSKSLSDPWGHYTMSE